MDHHVRRKYSRTPEQIIDRALAPLRSLTTHTDIVGVWYKADIISSSVSDTDSTDVLLVRLEGYAHPLLVVASSRQRTTGYQLHCQ